MRIVGFTLVFLLVGGWLTEVASARAQRVAFVVGNSAYQHSSPLTNPKHDAADMAAVLKGVGFHVIAGLDLSKAQMDRAIRDFAEALVNAKVGLFFYAGHGLQVSGENYLVPVDAKLTTAAALEFEMIRLALVQRVMEGAAETNVIFLDACRDNPLARNLARAMGTRSASIGRGLASTESGVGTLISFSTQPGNVALDGVGRNSPFAGALVEQLTSSQEDLSAILIGVRNKVIVETSNQQVPWEHSALRAKFYVREAPPGGTAAGDAPSQINEAAQTWAAAKDSTSEAVLKAFITKYKGTVFGELAKARLKELEDGRRGAVTSAVGQSGNVSRPEQVHPFDGTWEVSRTGESCPNKTGTFQINIKNGAVGGGKILGGSVSLNGSLTFDIAAPTSLNYVVQFTAKLSGSAGRGSFQTRDHPCKGTAVLKRLPPEAASQAQ